MSNIHVEIIDKIAVVTLQKEPLNVFDGAFYKEIHECFTELESRTDFRVVVLKSGCRHFAAGGSLQEIQQCLNHGGDDSRAGAETCANTMGAIYGFKKPVIAAVHGNAIGAGVAMASVCDIIIAEETSQFILPEITVGYIGASEFLQMLLPRRLARYYVYTGDPITGQMLKDCGRILDTGKNQEEVYEKAMTAARKIAQKAPMAVTLFKKAMNANDNERLKEKYMDEADMGLEYFYTTPDAKELAMSMVEKRKPVYSDEQ